MKITDISYEDLQREIFNKKLKPYINVEFITPTSFKSNGEYKIMPDEKIIINSIYNKMKKFSSIEIDEEEKYL